MEQPNTIYIDQLSGDDATFKMKIIAIIKTELPLEMASYQDYMIHKNYKNTADCVHKLKHKISVLGLEKSYYIAEQFENNLKNNSTTLQNEFEEILAFIQEFVNGL